MGSDNLGVVTLKGDINQIAGNIGEKSFEYVCDERVGLTTTFHVGDVIIVRIGSSSAIHHGLILKSGSVAFEGFGFYDFSMDQNKEKIKMTYIGKIPYDMVDNTTLELLYGKDQFVFYSSWQYRDIQEMKEEINDIERELERMRASLLEMKNQYGFNAL